MLFASVALAPLPFGSTDKVVIALWCVVLGAAVVLASPRQLRREQLLPLAAVAVVVVAYLLVLHEQLASEPWSGAAPHPIWDEAGRLLGQPLQPSIAIMHDEGFFAIGAPLAATLAFVAAYVVCCDRRRAGQLLRVVAWSGVAYAVLGIILFIVDPTKVLWREKLAYTSSLTATFVNRNTAAVYFGSCAVVCLLLLLQGLEARGRDAGPAVRRWLMTIEALRSRRDLAQPAAMLLVCITAMLMAGSRAGVVFSLIGLAVAYLAFYRRRWRDRRKLVIAVLTAAVAGAVLLQVFGGEVGNRFNEYGVERPGAIGDIQIDLRDDFRSSLVRHRSGQL